MNNKAEYTPEKVVDISNLSREDWLEYRKKGIGGSDVAAIMGISPFATIRDLFYNKTGVQPVIQEEEESNWVAKEVGHRLEDLVAEIFSKKTGLEVFPVRVMFRHPLYPFMLADVDFFVRIPDGTFAILECKTCNYNAKDKWADEGIPAHYVLQVRHYLSVMNMQKAFIACLYAPHIPCPHTGHNASSDGHTSYPNKQWRFLWYNRRHVPLPSRYSRSRNCNPEAPA